MVGRVSAGGVGDPVVGVAVSGVGVGIGAGAPLVADSAGGVGASSTPVTSKSARSPATVSGSCSSGGVESGPTTRGRR